MDSSDATCRSMHADPLQISSLQLASHADQAAAEAAERRSNQPDYHPADASTLKQRKYSASIDNKIDKLRRRFSTAGRTTDREDATSDASDGDSISMHSTQSGGNILDDLDTRSVASYVSGNSVGTVQSGGLGMSTGAGSSGSKTGASTSRDGILMSYHNTKSSMGLSKNRLPAQVGYDVQESLSPLVRAIGSVNAVTGCTYTFLCNFGDVYKAVAWHLTGAGKQVAADKERVGTIVHEKYLVPLSQCIVDMCEDSDQKQTFLQRTWKRLIQFQCRQSPFQESGCHAADCWLDGGILHVAVLAKYFGELPFQPMPLSIPEVNAANQSTMMPSFDSGMASAGDYISRSSSHEKAPAQGDDGLPECLKEDITRSTQLLHVALQVIADATKVPFTFECDFGSLSTIVSKSLHSRLATLVYNDYLMSISAIIVEYCEDASCRDDLVRNVYSRRIVVVVEDEEQLVKNWGYLVPAALGNADTASSDNIFLDIAVESVVGEGDGDDESCGQVVCKDGVLYLTVPLQAFSKKPFNPSLDVFEARRPKDECSRLNNFVSSHASSKNLPPTVCNDITEAATVLEANLEAVSRKLNLDLVLECNFESLFAVSAGSDRFAHGKALLATTVYNDYVSIVCKSLIHYLDEVTDRESLLIREMYNQKISFQLVSKSMVTKLIRCPQQYPLGGTAPLPTSSALQGLSDVADYTFLHRGVLRIVCLLESFGQGQYKIRIEDLPLVPDTIQVFSHAFTAFFWLAAARTVR